MSEDKEIFNYLLGLGCCYNCCMRYVCTKHVDFADIQNFLIKNNYITGETCENEEGSVKKKSKANPCVVCLGLLQDFTIDDTINNSGLLRVKEYDSQVFTCSISMPASILLREHSMQLHLEDKFSNFFVEDKEEVPLNRAWKIFIKDKLGKHIDKTFENSDTCDFCINISLEYEDDRKEVEVLRKMQPKIFEERTTQHRKYSGDLFSRKAVLSVLSLTHSGVFKMYATVPPDIPTKGLFCKNIECKHNSAYMAGRYCKYSRELSQSPWVIEGVKLMETSVQEIIFEGILMALGVTSECLKFASSGREDCDVRCLGRGRPFYIEIMDPKRIFYTFEEFRALEKLINKSELIEVIDLQMVQRGELTKIKEGEETKTKDYIALCITKGEVTEELINKINNAGPLDIMQKTPIRVLHRRPLAVRSRKIHSMSSKLIPGKPNLFELRVQTQAGTYVKEFVHGDFNRTTPNIGQIIGMEVDIIALDVMAINLDWPNAIDYEK